MNFSENKPIYLQICDYICERIVNKTWKNEDKIPSVREMAMDLEVNTNTVVRAFEQLTDWNIIYTKRGLGYFVSANGYEKTKDLLKKEFMEELLPQVFNRVMLLEVPFSELEQQFHQFQKNNPQ